MDNINYTYPRWMYVGNRAKTSKRGTPVLIIKVLDGKYWDDKGHSWKYGTPVNQ